MTTRLGTPHRTARSFMPLLLVAGALTTQGQSPTAPTKQSASITPQQLQTLVNEVQTAEEHARAAEQELATLKIRLQTLEASLHSPAPADAVANQPASGSPASTKAEAEDTAAVQSSEIATLDQSKVETAAKYPFRLTGLVLATTSVNSSAVDSPTAPTAALFGSGNLSLSLRQTLLGFEATGPHLAGASSSADLHVDFFGATSGTSYPNAGGLLRLRTAHAALDWPNTRLFFALDRPLLSPDSPTSLVQVAEPALAWSGNLWTWSPQLGLATHFGDAHRLTLQGAWISPPDPPYNGDTDVSTTRTQTATASEASHLPGGEARVSYASGDLLHGPRIGFGGYVSPHKIAGLGSFTAWAATMDLRLPITTRAELTAAGYRGQGLGGLGAGGYRDFVYGELNGVPHLRAVDDVGGWTQLGVHLTQSLDWNTAFGVDNSFAGQVRPFISGTNSYANIARNRSFYSNLIWSPRSSLLFSLEYRRLSTYPIIGKVWNADIVGAAAGYRF